jgi:hypothetical protein
MLNFRIRKINNFPELSFQKDIILYIDYYFSATRHLGETRRCISFLYTSVTNFPNGQDLIIIPYCLSRRNIFVFIIVFAMHRLGEMNLCISFWDTLCLIYETDKKQQFSRDCLSSWAISPVKGELEVKVSETCCLHNQGRYRLNLGAADRAREDFLFFL